MCVCVRAWQLRPGSSSSSSSESWARERGRLRAGQGWTSLKPIYPSANNQYRARSLYTLRPSAPRVCVCVCVLASRQIDPWRSREDRLLHLITRFFLFFHGVNLMRPDFVIASFFESDTFGWFTFKSRSWRSRWLPLLLLRLLLFLLKIVYVQSSSYFGWTLSHMYTTTERSLEFCKKNFKKPYLLSFLSRMTPERYANVSWWNSRL